MLITYKTSAEFSRKVREYELLTKSEYQYQKYHYSKNGEQYSECVFSLSRKPMWWWNPIIFKTKIINWGHTNAAIYPKLLTYRIVVQGYPDGEKNIAAKFFLISRFAIINQNKSDESP